MTTATKVKKSSTTRSTKSTKNAKRALVCANGEQCFWTTDGKIISNLVELRDAFSTMADDTFSYHANKGRNDFANWITDILHDAELAKSIKSANKPHTARAIVVRRLKLYDI